MATIEKKRSGTTDLTVGKPLFQILRFALPLVLGTLFQQLYLCPLLSASYMFLQSY